MKTPTIKWAQNDTFIFIDIELVPNDYKIDIKENQVSFKQGEYECDLDLFSKIIVDNSKYIKNRIFEFVLKKEEDKEWKQLLENKNQYKIGVNWDKCDISDDEEDTLNNGMPDMSSLMGGQGGMPSENLCPVCPNQNCEECCEECCEESYEDEFEVSTDEEGDETSQEASQEASEKSSDE